MSACKWAGRGEPRILPGRHGEDCRDEECPGCQPCEERHCGLCGIEHCDDAHPVTCPSCVGNVREDLGLVVDMFSRLEAEAINAGHRGEREGTVLGGDAMVMLAMRHREQTGLAADGDHSHESEADPIPPLLTLATWEDVWREHLGHEQAGEASVNAAANYLALVLTRMAQEVELPFEDFARDIRQTRGRLEDVLHDGIREETGAPCPKCDRALVKHYGHAEAFDSWECPSRRCDTWYLDHEYRRWVSNDYRANADALTAPDIEAEYGVPTGTVRGWATKREGEKRARVRKRGKDASGRLLYDVADVLATRDRAKSA